MRQLSAYVSKACYTVAYHAFHVNHWLANNKFCGCCGGLMQGELQTQEFVVRCIACGNIVYPRISPAIIVAIIKGDEILLARSHRFPPGRYSVIAGFVEPG